MKADHLPAGTARPPSWAASCQPSPGMARPLLPDRGPRGRLGPRKAPGPPARPGKRLRVEAGLGRPAQRPPGRARGLEVRPGWLREACGGRGSGPKSRPRVLRRSPAPGRGVRRGASGDRLLSRPPLYSGSIRGDAAYARCQSPASSSGGGRPGGVGRASGGWNQGSDVRGRNSGSERRSGGRAGERIDGLAETGGQAGARGPGRRGRRRSGCRGGGGCRRSGPRGARPPPAGDPSARPGRVGQPDVRGGSPVALARTPQLTQGGRLASDHPVRSYRKGLSGPGPRPDPCTSDPCT